MGMPQECLRDASGMPQIAAILKGLLGGGGKREGTAFPVPDPEANKSNEMNFQMIEVTPSIQILRISTIISHPSRRQRRQRRQPR